MLAGQQALPGQLLRNFLGLAVGRKALADPVLQPAVELALLGAVVNLENIYKPRCQDLLKGSNWLLPT